MLKEKLCSNAVWNLQVDHKFVGSITYWTHVVSLACYWACYTYINKRLIVAKLFHPLPHYSQGQHMHGSCADIHIYYVERYYIYIQL